MNRIVRGVVAASCALLFACSSESGDDSNATTGSTYLAFATSFKNYKSWEKFPVTVGDANDVHVMGPRTEYLNKRPPKGATEFPVGTILVKELEDGPELDRKVFAMVKRGGDYNATGARGWEWFELKNEAGGNVTIVWRGLGPPAGEKYGGDPTGGCNSCHGTAKAQDFVNSSGLAPQNL